MLPSAKIKHRIVIASHRENGRSPDIPPSEKGSPQLRPLSLCPTADFSEKRKWPMQAHIAGREGPATMRTRSSLVSRSHAKRRIDIAVHRKDGNGSHRHSSVPPRIATHFLRAPRTRHRNHRSLRQPSLGQPVMAHSERRAAEKTDQKTHRRGTASAKRTWIK